MQKLPLRDDFQENEAVIKSFATLYQQGSQVLKQHLGDVIKVAVHVYYKDQSPNDGKSELRQYLLSFLFYFYTRQAILTKTNHSMIVLETKHILTELIKTLNRDFSQEFGQIVSSLGPEATESIRSLLA